MKMYRAWYACNEIKEVEIIRQTPKQVVVRRRHWTLSGASEETFEAHEAKETQDYACYESFEDAKKGLVAYYEQRLENTRKMVLYAEKHLAYAKAIIAADVIRD